ncbi:MAG TPA: DUF3857 domain-containing protein [Pyrinomonadaceae bacterium]|jgi:hypothetical protein|nr:DUF3857 domain-containing protein [Pyrinomonadaceae bacterium]
MKFPRVFLQLLFVAVCLTFATGAAANPGDNDWRAVDPAELASTTPTVEKDADAEALFWEVRLLDEVDGTVPRTVLRHYVRIKIFTDRGRESQSKIDIPFFNNWRITDIAARTITPDNKILELKKEDIFERTIVKASGRKLKAKSFAMPGVVPGAIIEYRWREVRNDTIASYIRLQLQREVPIRLVKYYIKPLSLPDFPYGMRAKTFHGQNSPFVKEKDGFYSTTMENVPAFHEEPRMPPEDAVRPWILVYYSEDKKLAPAQYWKELGKQSHEQFKSWTKVNDEVKKSASEAIGDAASPEDKLQRLFEYSRAKIKNIDDDASGMTADERAKLKENKSPADTLKRGMGTSADIDMLFAAMAIASGFDARMAKLSDRSDTFFDPDFLDDYFLTTYDIAVRVGAEWRFYDPGSTYVPFGMLLWQEEGVDALIADPKEPIWVQTPISGPEKSLEKRTGKFRLLEDGTLEGDVRIEYTGHLAADKKEYNDDDSPSQREETLRDMVKSRMSTAELSEIKIENITDPIKAFVYAYHVRVPGYGQRTGKRLFFQAGVFSHGAGALFPSATRTHDVYFHYPWSERDEITIELPQGFALDSADAPAPITPAMTRDICAQMIKMSTDGHVLNYQRDFFFGGGKSILFPVRGYAAVKQLFDVVAQGNDHTITLKQSATN